MPIKTLSNFMSLCLYVFMSLCLYVFMSLCLYAQNLFLFLNTYTHIPRKIIFTKNNHYSKFLIFFYNKLKSFLELFNFADTVYITYVYKQIEFIQLPDFNGNLAFYKVNI